MLKTLKSNISSSRCWNFCCNCSSELVNKAYSYSLKTILLAEYKMLMDQRRRKKKK